MVDFRSTCRKTEFCELPSVSLRAQARDALRIGVAYDQIGNLHGKRPLSEILLGFGCAGLRPLSTRRRAICDPRRRQTYADLHFQDAPVRILHGILGVNAY